MFTRSLAPKEYKTAASSFRKRALKAKVKKNFENINKNLTKANNCVIVDVLKVFI